MNFTRFYKPIELKPALALFIIALGLSVSPSASTQQNGLFTEAQARRGQALYDGKCAACHGAQLEGGSSDALAGAKFMGKWGRGKHDVDDLYFITRTTMPFGAAGTLSNQQYIDVVAFMLKANGYRAGASELKPDSAALKKIKIASQGGVKDRMSDAPVAAEAKSANPGQPLSKSPTQEELNAAGSNSTDWLMSNHDYSGQRFTDLKQITPQNAGALRPACVYQASDTKAFHNNPVVYRGVMYITTSLSTIALDAANCRVR